MAGLLALTPAIADDNASRLAPSLHDSARVELELGGVWSARNDVAAPGDTGTRFSINDVSGSGPFPLGRVQVDFALTERQGLRLTAAPLSLSESGNLPSTVDFQGETFAPGPVDASYRFDTYRATWRYRFGDPAQFRWYAGLTLLVRDAEITLTRGAQSAGTQNTGLVPLLHLAAEYPLSSRWLFTAELDGAAAPQGRAFDLALKLGYALDDHWRLSAGLRSIEGGADNDEVYTFSWFNAAVVSLSRSF